jgi:hypothetical protein
VKWYEGVKIMEERKEVSTVESISTSATVAAPSVVAAPTVVYRLPADIEVFLQVLPGIAGSFATKHSEPRTIRDLSIGLAREITGQLVALGVCQRTTTALDGQYLATSGPVVAASQPAPVLGSNNGHGLQGAMVAHWATKEETRIPTL